MTPHKTTTDFSNIKALTFDVFGTVVNWRNSVVPQIASAAAKHGILEGDWWKFADLWRDGYGKACQLLSEEKIPWQTVDQIHRERLDQLLPRFKLDKALTEDEKDDLNRAWHRLDGWPDAVEGMYRLKSRFILSTLSNGNLSLLVNMAKFAGLPWDAILSADITGAYKPSPKVYQSAARLLDLPPEQIMMVAAHPHDLHAAKNEGMATALILRPFEYGRKSRAEHLYDTEAFDIIANDFLDLADHLGCTHEYMSGEHAIHIHG